MGPCQAPGTEPGRDAKALGLHTAGWHGFATLLLGRAVQRHPRAFKAAMLATFPIILEETSSSSFPLLWLWSQFFSKAGHVMPASRVSGCHGALPLGAQCLGRLLLPGVVNCSAFIIIISMFKSSPSSLLLPPGSWKLTSCLSDFVLLGPGSSPPRPGDGGSGSRAPPCHSSICPHVLILAGPCLFLLAWVKGPSVRLAICLVLWKRFGRRLLRV